MKHTAYTRQAQRVFCGVDNLVKDFNKMYKFNYKRKHF